MPIYPPGIKAVLRRLGKLEQQLDRHERKIMASVADLEAALTTLKGDLEAQTSAISAEFGKLEAELHEGVPPASLDAVKASIEGLDSAVKSIVVPSS